MLRSLVSVLSKMSLASLLSLPSLMFLILHVAGGCAGNDAGPGDNTTDCSDLGVWPAEATTFEAQVLQLVNAQRAQATNCASGGLFAATSPLQESPVLTCLARRHSQRMGLEHFFDHNDPDGSTPFARMTAAGYTYVTAGENIAAGQTTPAAVMQAWVNSPPHCSDLMNPNFTETGVGFFAPAGQAAAYPAYWTQDFAKPAPR